MESPTSPYVPTTETIERSPRPPPLDRLKQWLVRTRTHLYISHTLQAWGDRMWLFALGLFLVPLADCNLRVTATNSLCMAAGLVLFSHVIGYWIDLSKRLNVIRVSILVQNACVIACNALVFVALRRFPALLPASRLLFFSGIIALALLGRLASTASKIAQEKDWVVVLAAAGHGSLTDMNAVMRRIDMVTNILAPLFIGLLMDRLTHRFAAIFIVGWNVVSGVGEYCLLVKIYVSEPLLGLKAAPGATRGSSPDAKYVPSEKNGLEKGAVDLPGAPPAGDSDEEGGGGLAPLGVRYLNHVEQDVLERTTVHDLVDEMVRPLELEKCDESGSSESCLKASVNRFCFFFISFRDGCEAFLSYKVKLASLALSMLYMTVLSFHSVTLGYLLTQGVSETYIAVAMAFGSASGVAGTILFPYLKDKFGLERATLAGISLQICSISLCVVAMFLPGTPWHMLVPDTCLTVQAPTCGSMETAKPPLPSIISSVPTLATPNTTRPAVDSNLDLVNLAMEECEQMTHSRLSAVIFTFGLVLARAGLWMFDLGVSQLVQESVAEYDRGKFSGVQSCMNSAFELVHLVAIILIPSPHTFAWLVFSSYLTVCSACAMFVWYCHSESLAVLPRMSGLSACPITLRRRRSPNDATHLAVPDMNAAATAVTSVDATLLNNNFAPVSDA